MEGRPPLTTRSLLTPSALVAVVRRPHLWATALSAARSLVPPGWWRRSPHLPVPDADWMRFRIETAYGGHGDEPVRPDDLVTWLEWRRLGS